MKIDRLIAAFAFVLALSLSTAFAQPKPAAPQTPTQAAVSVPESKIALIYSDAFLDAKTGIARFNTLVTTLNREFQPRQTELQTMQQRITALTDEVNKMQAGSSVVDPKSIQTKMDTLEALKKDYQRKGEDAQAAYNKRRQDIFQPLQDDIGKALELYAKQRNINVIIDGSQVPLVYAADSIDITRAFINEFNSKNPATASIAPPK
jgi:Skp family chaperone for outer membrane proteins